MPEKLIFASDTDVEHRTHKILDILHGLPISQAENALDNAKRMIGYTHIVNTTDNDRFRLFREDLKRKQLEECGGQAA